MSQNLIEEILKKRAEYAKHLENDLSKNEEMIASATSKLEELELTTEHVKELGKKVEHEALIPLGKKVYVKGNIIHTGEYFLDKLAFPDSYSVVETLDSTIEHLQRKIKIQSELIQKGETSRQQLEERLKLIGGEETTNDLPNQIVSDKGVALKVGEFYEIFEFEN